MQRKILVHWMNDKLSFNDWAISPFARAMSNGISVLIKTQWRSATHHSQSLSAELILSISVVMQIIPTTQFQNQSQTKYSYHPLSLSLPLHVFYYEYLWCILVEDGMNSVRHLISHWPNSAGMQNSSIAYVMVKSNTRNSSGKNSSCLSLRSRFQIAFMDSLLQNFKWIAI